MFVIYSRIDLLNDKDDTFLGKNIVFVSIDAEKFFDIKRINFNDN